MRLAQLLDMSVVQRLAESNYQANGVPIGIVDAVDGSVLVACGWQDVCVKFHRVHPGSRARCEESDRYIRDHLSESGPCEYQCLNGLRDIGVPIVVAGRHLATLFLGQFFYDGEAPDRAFFVQQARQFGYDERQYLAALDRVPRLDRSAVETILAYNRALSRFIAETAEGTLRQLEVLAERQRAVADLAAEKERLAVTLASIGDAVIATDDAGRITVLNAVAEALTGWPARDAVGLPLHEVFDIVNEETRAPAVSPLGRVLDEGLTVGLANHTALVARDGRLRPIADSGAPIRDANGRISGMVLVFRDQTDERKAQEELRRARDEANARANQLEAVLGSIADGVIVYDRQGRTIRSTPAADRMLAVAPSDRRAPLLERLAGQYEIVGEDGRPVGPADAVAVRTAVHGETVRGIVQRISTPGHEPRWLMLSGTPFMVAGEHAGAVLSLTDVTERKRAEEELAVMTRLYAVLSRVNEAIVRTRDEPALFSEVCRIVAGDGGFPLAWLGLVEGRRVRPAAWWGPAAGYLDEVEVEIDGALGQGPTGTCIRENRPVLNHDFESNPSAAAWLAATRRHGLRASCAFPLRRGGKAIGALTLYAPSRGTFTDRHVALLQSLAADLSYALDAFEHDRLRARAEAALRESEQRLRDADRHKDDFIGMLSHELRNPLASIASSIFVLEHAEPGGDASGRARAVLRRQTEHLRRMVDDLLDVTRIARGKVELRRERLDLCAVATRTAEDHRAAIEGRGLRLHVRVAPEGAWIDADVTRLAQILGNLLSNATKFTPAGGAVTLEVRPRAGDVEVTVTDTGRGIDPVLLPRVFEPFVQGDGSLARTEGGLGLGLALVKGLAEAHGGEALADSAGPGRGASFTVRLPRTTPAASAGAQPASAAVPARRRRVLVVDDHRDGAQSLADVLQMLGHTVEVAYDGPEAIARARANPPEVVLCDIGLPGMSGYEVAAALRAICPEGARLLAVSGYARQEDVRKAAEAGFHGHLAKPLDVEQIARALA
jgi:PAS domain S-box-containing protein